MRKVKVFNNAKKESLLYTGLFHQFGIDGVELDTGGISWTTAIIELDDGTIIQPSVDQVVFDKEI